MPTIIVALELNAQISPSPFIYDGEISPFASFLRHIYIDKQISVPTTVNTQLEKK